MDLTNRYPTNDPIIIGSDRMAKNSDVGTITDTQSVSTAGYIQVLAAAEEHWSMPTAPQ